jgi:hypothetical protein
LERSVKKHKCEECGEVFNHGIGLRKHQRNAGHKGIETWEVVSGQKNEFNSQLADMAKQLQWECMSSKGRDVRVSHEFAADLDEFSRSLSNSPYLGATLCNELQHGLGNALGHRIVDWMWDTARPSFGQSKNRQDPEAISVTVNSSDREFYEEMMERVSRDFALETGVFLPGVVFKEGDRLSFSWRGKSLGRITPGEEWELLQLLKRNSWRFLSVSQVEDRLTELWADRPELYRAFKEVRLNVVLTVRYLRELLMSRSYIKEFDVVIETLILNTGVEESVPDAEETPTEPEPDLYQQSLSEDVTILIGRDLLSLVDRMKGAPLVRQVTCLRRNLVKELGWVTPEVRLREEPSLKSDCFQIKVRDSLEFEGEVSVGSLLAMGPVEKLGQLKGVKATDPIFETPAVWVEPELRHLCEGFGCLMCPPDVVIGAALGKTLRARAGDLFNLSSVDGHLKALKERHPTLVKFFEQSPKLFKQARDVFRRLLTEGVSIKDQVTILETIVDHEDCGLSTEVLTEKVRQRIKVMDCESVDPELNQATETSPRASDRKARLHRPSPRSRRGTKRTKKVRRSVGSVE